jgi:RNA polymerase sigma-70 factor (ECF subfamily)
LREPDPELIRRAQSGDLSAFERLVRECQADAWRFAYHLTRNRATADDVTQESFLRAFRAIRTYRGRSRFSSWLLRIVRNCAIDAFHRGARETPVEDEALAWRSGGGSTETAEERIRIHQAIRNLPLWLREPFVMIDVLGFSYEEVATILSIRIGTVKSRMHRARAALVQALTEGDLADEM